MNRNRKESNLETIHITFNDIECINKGKMRTSILKHQLFLIKIRND